ncbi:MAG: DUF4445 domain-containing protein [Nitrospirae bacterium]|nr:DUF4445 domain-containing protein [Nitrospirota bacterium]
MDGPLVTKHYLELTPPTGDDPLADLERLSAGLAASGVPGIEAIDVPLSVAAAIPAALRESGFRATASVGHGTGTRLVRVEPGDTTARNYGLAVDLGTTNVVGTLLDLNTGAALGEASEVNPQVVHGEDILTRIHFCLKAGNLELLQGEAAGCISTIAARLAVAAGISATDITCVSVSGNTTMAHLLLGLDPYNICRAPYVPAAFSFGTLRARDLRLAVNPEAVVYVLPNVGSYVGGDVLAGVLVSGMHGRDGVSILVDVGTNAEIVIGNRDWLLVCAGAAGPALEGGVVRFGMRAMPGAIDRVRIDPATFEPEFTVLGGVKPKGLCGSALIDLLAELFTTGLIDGRGKFADPGLSRRIIELEGRRAYVVAYAPDTYDGADGGLDIVFTENDIDNLIRTKAAMYTALSVVTRELGITFGMLENFFIAGTFGAYIAADKAVAMGMVPDIELSKYRLLGNSSLAGACRVLLSREALREIDAIASMITYKQLNVSTDFMSEFRAAMFLPHTDSSLFPSVTS